MVPKHATVAVVSKGDAELIRLGGRRAWHFPRDEADATQLHPENSAAAIAELRAAQADGATHIVFPATAFWWLEYYTDLREYLEQRAHLVLREEDSCLIFELASP